jgi:hypothetical protein
VSEHPSHVLDAYKNEPFKWTVFCKTCSREGEQLQEPCPGEFSLFSLKKDIDAVKEHR